MKLSCKPRRRTALGIAYAVIATERDCHGSFGAKILHASRLLGHFTKEIKDDRDLVHLGTSAGYSDYFVSKPVSFPAIPEKEKPAQVRVTPDDFEAIKQLQEHWKLPNQQSVISRLLETQEKLVELGKRLLEANTRINQLEKEKVEMSQVETQQITVTPSELEAMIERMVSEKVQQALASLPVTQSDSQPKESKPVTKAPIKQEEEIDWSGMANTDLWGTKVKGASEEKIRRSYEAICLYNDTVATGEDDRLAITNQALRELSGVNGLIVGDWIKAHADEIITHNSKYGMQNAKDPSKTETYQNTNHGQEKITKILSLVNSKFLDRVALKSHEPENNNQSALTSKEKIKPLSKTATMMDIHESLAQNPGYQVQIKAEGKTATYEAVWDEAGQLKAAKCLEDGVVSEVK